jgi:hypothetical protein
MSLRCRYISGIGRSRRGLGESLQGLLLFQELPEGRARRAPTRQAQYCLPQPLEPKKSSVRGPTASRSGFLATRSSSSGPSRAASSA